MGLIVGLAAGKLHLTGAYVMLGSLVSIYAFSNLYAYRVLKVKDNDFQNSELIMEGLPNSFGVFLVSAPPRPVFSDVTLANLIILFYS